MITHLTIEYSAIPKEELKTNFDALHRKVGGIIGRCLRTLADLNTVLSNSQFSSGDIEIQVTILLIEAAEFPNIISHLRSLETAYKISLKKYSLFDWCHLPLQLIRGATGLIGFCSSIVYLSAKPDKESSDEKILVVAAISWAASAISSYVITFFEKVSAPSNSREKVFDLLNKDLLLMIGLVEVVRLAQSILQKKARPAVGDSSSDEQQAFSSRRIPPQNIRKRRKVLPNPALTPETSD